MREREKQNEKRKLRKGKVVLTVVSIVILIAVIIGVVLFVKNKMGGSEGGRVQEEQNEVYDLPDVTYSEMQVTDVKMEYLKNNDETMVTMTINNTTENQVTKESLTAILLDKDGTTLGQTRTYIESLAPGAQYSISVILKGDLTSTTQIQLQK